MNEPSKVITAAILVIGDEILSGRTKDRNVGYIAEYLTNIGIELREARVVPDVEEEIVAALNALRARYTYVFTTGGIGPTHDDITAQCIADAFGVPLVLHPEAVRILTDHYPPGALNEARLRMAHVPEGATLLQNPISRAPGFRVENVFILPGVPQIMQAIFNELKHQLRGGAKVLTRSVSCGLGEGPIAKGLADIQDRYSDCEIGSYPYFRRADFGVTLVVRGTDRARIEAAAEDIKTLIRGLGGDPTDGLAVD
jgi:molybdenum cofactor synthesis domain-containing protein